MDRGHAEETMTSNLSVLNYSIDQYTTDEIIAQVDSKINSMAQQGY